jgi:hypothetical protein
MVLLPAFTILKPSSKIGCGLYYLLQKYITKKENSSFIDKKRRSIFGVVSPDFDDG